MNQEYISQFDKHWNTFATKLHGQIKKRSEKGLPSHSQLNVILKDCALDWTSNETTCGRWLMTLAKESPEKAKLIGQILLEDMQFKELSAVPGISPVMKTAVPAAGAVAGLVISYFAGAGSAVQIASAVVPAVVLGSVMKSAAKDNAGKGVQAYLEQLTLYYSSILSILQQ